MLAADLEAAAADRHRRRAARDDLALALGAALSFVAQSARGADAAGVPAAALDAAATAAERFLVEWRGEADPSHARAVDAYWVCAAEHGMNASTFTARVVASTGADVAAALSAAVGALSGPLHGGAPTPCAEDARRGRRDGRCPAVGRRGARPGERLMGFGHRVYRAEDPRARVLRRTARELGARGSRWRRRSRQAALAELRASAAPTACSRPTSSSGRRWCSTSPRFPPTSSRRCSRARGRPAGPRT